MKQYTDNYYRVLYKGGGEDCTHCATLADAEFRQKEIREMQIARGYTPDETHIYFCEWHRVIDNDGLLERESQTRKLVK